MYLDPLTPVRMMDLWDGYEMEMEMELDPHGPSLVVKTVQASYTIRHLDLQVSVSLDACRSGRNCRTKGSRIAQGTGRIV